MLQRFQAEGNIKMARRLEAAPVGDRVPLPDAYLTVRDPATHQLDVGTTRQVRSVVNEMLLPSLLNSEYTLTKMVTRLEIPVYFLHDVHDYTVSYPLAKAYFELLEAPVKGFYTFKHSAHSPFFEEPEKMRKIMRVDVLMESASLADSK
jgi:pimeloyl-ACP methyl ester carboxylesterase